MEHVGVDRSEVDGYRMIINFQPKHSLSTSHRQGSPSGQGGRVPVDPQTIIQCYICKGKVMAQDLPLHVKNAHHNQPENVKQQALRARFTAGPSSIAPKPSSGGPREVITLDDSPRKPPFGGVGNGRTPTSAPRGVSGTGSQAGSLRINPTLQAGKSKSSI